MPTIPIIPVLLLAVFGAVLRARMRLIPALGVVTALVIVVLAHQATAVGQLLDLLAIAILGAAAGADRSLRHRSPG